MEDRSLEERYSFTSLGLILLNGLAIFLISQCFFYRYLHPLARYPGPFLASVTNLWRFYHFHKGQSHLGDVELHKKYGDVVRTGPHSLSFSSPKAYEVIYGFDPGFEKGDFFKFGRDDQKNPTNLFGARTLDIHRTRKRKIVGPALTVDKSRSYGPIIKAHVDDLISQIETAEGRFREELQDGLASSSPAFSLNVEPLVHTFVFDCLMRVVFGPTISSTSNPWTQSARGQGILKGVRVNTRAAWTTAFVPFLRWLMRTKPAQKIIRRPRMDEEGNLTGVGALGAATSELVFKAAKPNATGAEKEQVERVTSEQSIASSLIQAHIDNAEANLNPRQIWGETFNLTLAGPQTVAAGLLAALHCLGSVKGQSWQEKIRNETASGQDPMNSISLLAAVKESLRLHPPFAMGFPREVFAGSGRNIPGVENSLPDGTEVSVNIFVVGRDSSWGEDAEVWNPDRWAQMGKDSEEKFVAFGKGPRSCIGREIAMVMICMTVAEVLKKWNIVACGELKGNCWVEMIYSDCFLILEDV